jgi:catechol 2,3-dioxygenase-like lactoylglutathione lyase family enzyme
MRDAQFRFAYFTPKYEETVNFYRQGLDLKTIETWDRTPDDRGTLFGAASGVIEVLALPGNAAQSDHLWDDRPPQGAFMVIEVDQVESLYQRALETGLPIQQELKDQEWGHRSFCVREPNGLTLNFFRELQGRDEC